MYVHYKYTRTHIFQHLTFSGLDNSLLDEFIPVPSERQFAVKIYN